VQRPADGRAKTILVVVCFGGWFSIERVWRRIQTGPTIVIEEGTMWLVGVESPAAATAASSTAHHNDHGPAATSPESASAKTATAEPAASAEELNAARAAIHHPATLLIAHFSDAVLYVAGIQDVLFGASLGPG